MVTLEDLSHDKKAAILNLARLHGARGIRVYGSVARGQATEQSDLDLLVEFCEKPSRYEERILVPASHPGAVSAGWELRPGRP